MPIIDRATGKLLNSDPVCAASDDAEPYTGVERGSTALAYQPPALTEVPYGFWRCGRIRPGGIGCQRVFPKSTNAIFRDGVEFAICADCAEQQPQPGQRDTWYEWATGRAWPVEVGR